jgi:hypothetical protein
LVRRLQIGEAGFQVVLPDRVRAEGVAGGGLAGGIEGQQFLGDALDCRLDPGLGVFPVGAGEAREGGTPLAGANVTAHPIDVVHGHEEPVAGGIVQMEILPFRALHGHLGQSAEDTDPMFNVHDIVAGLQFAEKGVPAGASLAGGPARTHPTEDLSIGERQGARHPALGRATL